jgi:hypothetical protein
MRSWFRPCRVRVRSRSSDDLRSRPAPSTICVRGEAAGGDRICCCRNRHRSTDPCLPSARLNDPPHRGSALSASRSNCRRAESRQVVVASGRECSGAVASVREPSRGLDQRDVVRCGRTLPSAVVPRLVRVPAGHRRNSIRDQPVTTSSLAVLPPVPPSGHGSTTPARSWQPTATTGRCGPCTQGSWPRRSCPRRTHQQCRAITAARRCRSWRPPRTHEKRASLDGPDGERRHLTAVREGGLTQRAAQATTGERRATRDGCNRHWHRVSRSTQRSMSQGAPVEDGLPLRGYWWRSSMRHLALPRRP